MELKQIDGNILDLSQVENFVSHYNNKSSCADIVLNQINDGYYSQFFKDRKDLTLIDAGANVGLFSLYILPICKQIYAYEPTDSHFNLFTELLEKFDANKIVVPNKVAINNYDGHVTFNTGNVNSTMNSMVKHGDHSTSIEVECKTLNSITLDKVVDFLKCDIEGGEQNVFLDENFNNNINTMLIEVHEGLGADFNAIWEKLLSLGYSLSKINSDGIYAVI